MKRVVMLVGAIGLAVGLGVALWRAGALDTDEPRLKPAAPRGEPKGSDDPAHASAPPAVPAPAPADSGMKAPVQTQASSSAAAERQASPDAIPGEHILSFYSERDRDAFLKLCRSMGVEVLGVLRLGYSVRIRVRDARQFADLLAEAPVPVNRAPNTYVRVPEEVGTNPQAPQASYVGFGDLWLRWLGVGEAHADWGRGVTVAVLDTGVARHASLPDGKVTWAGIGNGSAAGADPVGHGTAVASLIAGNGEGGVSGIAPGASILSVPVLGADGTGDSFSLAQGIVEALDRGARVIALSLASHADSYLVQQAVELAAQKGAIVVAATGNDAVEGVAYPARYDGVVAVSAVDAAGQHLYFSNRGPEVDVAAPGLALTAATAEPHVATNFTGTSAAVPVVSGVLAALLSQDPTLSASDAVAILTTCCDDAGVPGADAEFGAGILDVARIMNRDEEGIYDVGVGYPCLREGGSTEDPYVVVYAQNRGTEKLSAVELSVEASGVTQSKVFYDVGVSETVSFDFRVASAQVRLVGSMDLSVTATARGVEDARPLNNTVKASILLNESAP